MREGGVGERERERAPCPYIMRPCIYVPQTGWIRVPHTCDIQFQNPPEPRPQDGHHITTVAARKKEKQWYIDGAATNRRMKH